MTYNTINDAVTMAGGGETLLANRYRVVRQLGQGGMGSVWLAEDTQLDGKQFAIKMLPSVLVSNTRAYRQLKDEALVAMKLTHPNIVTLRAFEENNGNPFLVMDYVDGRTLDDYLAEKVKLSEDETVKLLRPIATALDYAHGEGVVHRDVKPANVLIRKDGHPYILDFGIAREIQETMTRVTGKLSSGTLLYMSPEQLNGESPKPSQDVYSFAAMVYECLKGEPPFARGAIEDQIKNKEPEPLIGRAVPNAPQSIAASVMAGLAKRQEDRPTSCVSVLGCGKFSRAEYAGTVERGISSAVGGEDGVGRKERKAGGGKVLAIIALVSALGVGGWWICTRQQEDTWCGQSKIVAEQEADAERKAREEAERKTREDEARIAAEKASSERKAEAAAKAAATAIRIEAKVQQGKVEKILDDDGFGERKEALSEVFARADALFDEKVRRWSEATQAFSNYVGQCKALLKFDGERHEARKGRIRAQEACRKAEAEGASKYAVVSWNASVETWKRAEAEFGRAEFSAARDTFVAVADQFINCGKEAKEKEEKIAADAVSSMNAFLESLLRSLEGLETAEEKLHRANQWLERIQKADQRGITQNELSKARTDVEKGDQFVANARERLFELCSTNYMHVPFLARLATTSHDYQTAVKNLSALKRLYTSSHPDVQLQDRIVSNRLQSLKEAVTLAASLMKRKGSLYYISSEDALRILEQDIMAFEFLECKLSSELRSQLRGQYEIYEGAYLKKKLLLVNFTPEHPEVLAVARQMDGALAAFRETIHSLAGRKNGQHDVAKHMRDGFAPIKDGLESSSGKHFQQRVAGDSGTVYLERALMPFVRNGSLPGAIGVLYKNGLQETAFMGWANVERRIPMSMDKTFMICSQSKGFCGVCIAMLIEQKKIDLDDPVSKYLSQFASMTVETKDSGAIRDRHIAQHQISIRHLLTHCAGFSFDVPSTSKNGWTSCPISKVVDEAASAPLNFEPGTHIRYSNVGFAIAAAIIEKVSGQKYETFLKNKILSPLGMRDTTFNPTAEQLSRQISVYKISSTETPQCTAGTAWMPLPHNGPTVYPNAAMGLWSTTEDLLKFYRMLMLGGIGSNGARLLKEHTVRTILATSQRPSNIDSAQGYSLGFVILRDEFGSWIGHGGALGTNFKVNIDKQELALWIVQLSGGPRPWDTKRDEAITEFFSHVQ